MSRLLRTALALGAVFFALIALSACGDSVPGSDVVKVDNTTIAKTTFAHWLAVSAKSQQQQAGATAVLPDAPDFTKCIAAAKAAAPTPVKGQPKPTDAQFKATCKQQYDQQRDQVMTFLIRSQWLEAEAAKQGIKVTDAEVKAAFDKARKQAFPKTADYVKFLKTSGQTAGRPALPPAHAAARAEDHGEDHEELRQRDRQGHPGLLREEQEAVHDA